MTSTMRTLLCFGLLLVTAAAGASQLPLAEGAVGAGTGARVGSASDKVSPGGFGTWSEAVATWQVAAGVAVNAAGSVIDPATGEVLAGGPPKRGPLRASLGEQTTLAVVVTDAPVDAHACARLARRVGLGLARTGSVAHHGSGEIFLGVGTGVRLDRDGRPDGPATAVGRGLDHLFEAVVECAEEAVLNSLLTAPTVVGRGGNVSEGLVLREGWR